MYFILQTEFDFDELQLAWEYFAVCVPIVSIFAPLGSFISSHFHRQTLALFIYILETVAIVSWYWGSHEIISILSGICIRNNPTGSRSLYNLSLNCRSRISLLLSSCLFGSEIHFTGKSCSPTKFNSGNREWNILNRNLSWVAILHKRVKKSISWNIHA